VFLGNAGLLGRLPLEKKIVLLLFFHNYYLWGGKDPESVDDNALWKMGGF